MEKKEQSDMRRFYADIARAYFKSKQVFRFHLKKISDMDDGEVIQKCHWWYTENGLEEDYRAFEALYERELRG